MLLSYCDDKTLTIKNNDGNTPFYLIFLNETDPKIFEVLLKYANDKLLYIKNGENTPVEVLNSKPLNIKQPIIKVIVEHFDKKYLKRAERRGTIFVKIKALIEANPNILEEYTDKGYTVMNVFIQETLGKKILEKQEKREKERLKKIRHLKGLTSKPSSSKTSSPLSLENLVKDVSKSKSRSKNVATNTQKSFA